MARSMTGFGRGQVDMQERRCVVEIRAVNSKYCDLQIKLPRILYGIENRIRETATAGILRGKAEVYVTYDDYREDSKSVECDTALVNAYYTALKSIADAIGSDERIYASTLARFSDVLKVSAGEPDDEEAWRFVSPALTQALAALAAMRGNEGKALSASIRSNLSELKDQFHFVGQRAPGVTVEFASRLRQRITDLAGELAVQNIDEQRLAMEIAIFADKCAIDEELTRLDSHTRQFEDTLDESGSIGKKLDFIVQEMNREINTIGSKANDVIITGYVMRMKNDLEKIREQIQNLE
ncbi:MAG: YicC/YloC family endoribonuclease [Saccharofermentanales bacterium]